MGKFEQAERLARIVLWLVLAGVLVVAFAVAPLQMLQRNADLEQAKRELAVAVEKLSAPPVPEVEQQLPVGTMGTLLRRMAFDDFTAHAYFTNVSPRSGHVCLTGTLRSASGEEVRSLAGCSKVAPFSPAEVQMMFPGGTVAQLCPGGSSSCTLAAVVDATQGADEPQKAPPAAPAAPAAATLDSLPTEKK